LVNLFELKHTALLVQQIYAAYILQCSTDTYVTIIWKSYAHFNCLYLL